MQPTNHIETAILSLTRSVESLPASKARNVMLSDLTRLLGTSKLLRMDDMGSEGAVEPSAIPQTIGGTAIPQQANHWMGCICPAKGVRARACTAKYHI